MGYHSDPTASLAMGPINREFKKRIKKAKELKSLLAEGKISEKDIEKAQVEYTGLYRHILTYVLTHEVIEED